MGRPKRQQRRPHEWTPPKPSRGRLAAGLPPLTVDAAPCSGDRYPSEPVAVNAATALNWSGRVTAEVEAYECAGCDGWHVRPVSA